jgi:Homeodomain-like domain-containing protein
MYQILNETERAELLKHHKRERDGRIKDRTKAVLLYDGGWTPPKIAKALFIDEGTVRVIFSLTSRGAASHKSFLCQTLFVYSTTALMLSLKVFSTP